MNLKRSSLSSVAAGVAVALVLFAGTAAVALLAQQGAPANFLNTTDANKDGSITRDELRGAMAKWVPAGGAATLEQLEAGLDKAFPESMVMSLFSRPGPQNQTPKPEDVTRMMAALPAQAPAKPKKPRKVLVLSKAAGFVHSCIPLAGKTVEELGNKTGAWNTTISYDPAVITAANLKQYDALFLNNTTGAFLDDADPAVTNARKTALLEFVRSGKGLAGIHAASDSYHETARTGGASGPAVMFATRILSGADKDSDKKVSTEEMGALSDAWFDRLDTSKAGKVSVADFQARLGGVMFSTGGARRGPPQPQPARTGRDNQTGTWPEFNHMIGAYFKWHWNDPTHIVYKIDDPASPINAMFRGIQFEIDDETYTFSVNSWSRENVHVLTSVDYSKMSEADKLKEDYPREDHDYGLSWIRREGKGRVFYEAHGHNERVYAIKPMLEHLTAGIQYALGDLKADDSPSVKPKK